MLSSSQCFVLVRGFCNTLLQLAPEVWSVPVHRKNNECSSQSLKRDMPSSCFYTHPRRNSSSSHTNRGAMAKACDVKEWE